MFESKNVLPAATKVLFSLLFCTFTAPKHKFLFSACALIFNFVASNGNSAFPIQIFSGNLMYFDQKVITKVVAKNHEFCKITYLHKKTIYLKSINSEQSSCFDN